MLQIPDGRDLAVFQIDRRETAWSRHPRWTCPTHLVTIPPMKTEEDWLIGLKKNARIEVLNSIFAAEKNELHA